MQWADVYLGLRGAFDLQQHADVLAVNQQAMGRISALRWETTRWCLARVPKAHFAEQAEPDVDVVMAIYFSACLLDWRAVRDLGGHSTAPGVGL